MSTEFAFWLSLGGITYPVLVYPLILLFLRSLVYRPTLKKPIEPSVSLIIPAHNEAEVISAKIQNTLELDYPRELLEIVVASDGSTDETVSIARQFEDRKCLRVVAYSKKRGKTSTVNDTVPGLKGDIVILSDASAILAPDAIRRLVANFADETVGAVSGAHNVVKPNDGILDTSEYLYWKYEAFVRRLESSIASVLGCHGSFYAVRKNLYPYPVSDTINDDYVIPLRILQRGYRVVYEPGAVVQEESGEMSGFRRRVRLMMGNIQQLAEVKGLLRPPQWLPLFFCFSHKVWRLALPFCMLVLFLSNLFLLEAPLYFGLFGLQLTFFLIAGLAIIWPLRPQFLRLPYYFCMVNAAALVATYHALSGRQQVPWK